MKVGTDGVLLGAWAPECIAGGRILDIGTGTGVMAIMAAQRNPSARIVGVEIDDMSALQARENAEASPWADRVEIVNADIRSYEAAAPFDGAQRVPREGLRAFVREALMSVCSGQAAASPMKLKEFEIIISCDC